MKDDFMLQCELSKFTMKGGTVHTTAWLPKRFCKKGNFVSLKNDEGEWEIGWLVEKVGKVHMETAEIRERGQDYKRTRKHSDI